MPDTGIIATPLYTEPDLCHHMTPLGHSNNDLMTDEVSNKIMSQFVVNIVCAEGVAVLAARAFFISLLAL